MPAYSFKKQFVSAVETGQKTITIRQTLRGAAKGKTAHLYYGLRTKQCRKIGEGVIEFAVSIRFEESESGKLVAIIAPDENNPLFRLKLEDGGLEKLAADDGFDSVEAMHAFFKQQYTLPFEGFVIAWNLKGAAA
jgi:hypothetical protein